MLTHFNEDGKAIMVDVTEKKETKRVAIISRDGTVREGFYENC